MSTITKQMVINRLQEMCSLSSAEAKHCTEAFFATWQQLLHEQGAVRWKGFGQFVMTQKRVSFFQKKPPEVLADTVRFEASPQLKQRIKKHRIKNNHSLSQEEEFNETD